MIEIRRLEFINNEARLKLADGSPLAIRAVPSERSLPYGILLTAFGNEFLFTDFAAVQTAFVENSQVTFEPEVFCVTSSGQHPFVAIVGLCSIVFINVQNKTINEILQFHRQPSEDQGFYQLNLLPLADGFLIIYESGAARISENGNVIWHCRLAWDDIYLRTDGELLYYSSELGEFAPNDWAISIGNGAKIKLTQA